MSKTSSSSPTTPFLKPHPEGTLLSLKVIPRASKNEIGETLGNELKIKVTAPPVDSAANRAVIEFIAEKLGCPKSAVVLIRGETARHKTLLLKGLTPEQVTAILAK
jgi:uncharacterized protein (TIGR00251 family)